MPASGSNVEQTELNTFYILNFIPDDPITPRIFNNLINKHSKTLVADKVLGIETYKDSTTSFSRRLSVWCRKDKEEKNKLNP